MTLHAPTNRIPAARHHGTAPAFILVAVLIVIMLMSMVAVSVLFRLQAEEAASAATGASEQAWSAAMTGVEEAIRVARQGAADPLVWQDNPHRLRDRFVGDDGANRWYFSVYSAADAVNSREEIRFGLTDEAGKCNVNTATETNLLRLPNLTAAQVQALLDFLDADDTARPEGAEQEYYDALPQPYTVHNWPLSSLDELLLVRGFTPALLHGEDANLNFRLDANEDDGDQTLPRDNNDGKLDRGLAPCLTVSAYDLNQDNDGVPRTNLNDPDDPLPQVDLPPALTNYIAALRANKITVAQPADLLEAQGKFKDPSGKEVTLDSGVGKNELSLLLDLFTTTTEERLTGLINVNTASARVLATVPDIDEALAETIVSARGNVAPERRKTIAWLYSEGVVEADVFKRIAPRLTARTFQYSFHVVGYGVPSGQYRVLEVILDCGQGQPAIPYLRDLTRLGLPFPIEVTAEGEAKSVARHQAPGPPPARLPRSAVRSTPEVPRG